MMARNRSGPLYINSASQITKRRQRPQFHRDPTRFKTAPQTIDTQKEDKLNCNRNYSRRISFSPPLHPTPLLVSGRKGWSLASPPTHLPLEGTGMYKMEDDRRRDRPVAQFPLGPPSLRGPVCGPCFLLAAFCQAPRAVAPGGRIPSGPARLMASHPGYPASPLGHRPKASVSIGFPGATGLFFSCPVNER